MKTKSKRFLNLATLCLALLGTTLLMAHPVKAEVIQKGEYMAQFGKYDPANYPSNLEARYKGYSEGYGKGFNGDDMPERLNMQVPEDVQSSGDSDDYRDGYEEGYGQGRHEGYPVVAFLEDVLKSVWGFLTGIFEGGSSDDAGSHLSK
ncbi:hypothetical protein [Streptococcus pyogenes]|uniref:hypothetical protein n=1 Tax=Streptococcus pyogenes TaxID=1314 RepID=UPI0010A0CA56|nr:hypothetical protein [Streptococcus pyogenes]VHC89489.1 Uncharacterised protein [Streptococcus pyogenes]VHC90931.1 Uncharacterised protein [Streptococcus pyogenes]VHD01988.1 Uncharacterised protein [Streptococcus pyogenes]